MTILGLLRSPVTFHFKMAGLICVQVGPWALHLFVKKSCWVWGFEEDWYDGPLPNYGLGPLFLLAGMDPDGWCYFCDTDRCKDRMRHGPWWEVT